MPNTRAADLGGGPVAYEADQNPMTTVALQAAMETLERAAVHLSPDRTRATALVVIRESAEYDQVLMDGMIASTVGTFADLAGSARVALLGMKLVLNPELCGPGVRVLKEGRARAVLLEVEGVFWLLSMSTAAKSNSKGENDFTLLLCKLIVELRPRKLCAATFSRLVRTFQHGADLLTYVIRHVDTVIAGTQQMDMEGPNRSQGMILWSTFAMISTAEREAILMRLTAGMVNKYKRRDQWILGRNAFPPGYEVDSTGHLVCMPKMKPLVQRMVELLADRERPDWLIVKELSDLEVDGQKLRTPKMLRTNVRLDELKAASRIRSWLYWLPVLSTGTHTHRVISPFPGAKRFSDMDVVDGGDGQPGFLEFAYEPGLPPGGWAPSELLLAAAARRHTSRSSGTGSAVRRSPFVGLSWSREGVAYSITANRSQQYEIRATTRPVR